MEKSQSEGQFVPEFTEITRYNVKSALPVVLETLTRAAFVSIDTEFTGLGQEGKKHMNSNISERYTNLKQIIQQRGVVSLGICAFISGETEGLYEVAGFEIITLCYRSHTLEPNSLIFLNKNGFSFDRLVEYGIPYIPGTLNKSVYKNMDTNVCLRRLFNALLLCRRPIVTHNGLWDLMYMYHALYNDLPETLDTFISDLSEMFPGGIYDTKYIAEYLTTESSTFLRYLFRKSERLQQKLLSEPSQIPQVCCVTGKHREIPLDDPVTPIPKTPGRKASSKPQKNNLEYCEQYALHGFCDMDEDKCKSHDVDFILDCIQGAEGRASKKPKIEEQPSSSTRMGRCEHSACYDAYMTGYIFACQKLTENNISQAKNKLYLMGKNIPLLVKKSEFASISKNHLTSLKRLNSQKALYVENISAQGCSTLTEK